MFLSSKIKNKKFSLTVTFLFFFFFPETPRQNSALSLFLFPSSQDFESWQLEAIALRGKKSARGPLQVSSYSCSRNAGLHGRKCGDVFTAQETVRFPGVRFSHAFPFLGPFALAAGGDLGVPEPGTSTPLFPGHPTRPPPPPNSCVPPSSYRGARCHRKVRMFTL